MNDNGIRSFEDRVNGNALSREVVYAVNQVLEATKTQILSHQQVQLLVECLTSHYSDYFKGATASLSNVEDSFENDPKYGAEFDLSDEVNQQIRAVRALRNHVLDESGNIKDGSGPRDVKEMIASSNTLLSSLMKFHDKIINQNRMRLIEQATVEAVKTLPTENQEIFFQKLQEGLDKIG